MGKGFAAVLPGNSGNLPQKTNFSFYHSTITKNPTLRSVQPSAVQQKFGAPQRNITFGFGAHKKRDFEEISSPFLQNKDISNLIPNKIEKIESEDSDYDTEKPLNLPSPVYKPDITGIDEEAQKFIQQEVQHKPI